MTRRDRTDEAAGAKLTYLPEHCDRFLLGYVERSGGEEKLACYGYQAAKAHLHELYSDSRRLYAELQLLESEQNSDSVMWLFRYARKELWSRINETGYKRWESLDRAVIGIGAVKRVEQGIVYNKALCVDILNSDTAASVLTPGRTQLDAINFVEEKIVKVDLQEGSPWFLTHIK